MLRRTSPTQPPGIRFGAGAVLAALALLSGCSAANEATPTQGGTTATPGSNATTTTARPEALGSTRPIVTIGSNAPPPTGDRPPSAAVEKLVADTRGGLGLQDAEAGCLARRVEADPTLITDLVGAAKPQEANRWIDYSNLAADCVRTTTGAANFANSIQAQAGGTLPEPTLVCLRDKFAALSPEDTGAIVRQGLNPGTVDTDTQQKTLRLLTDCGINPDDLPGTPPR